jgi:hypothetical protein
MQATASVVGAVRPDQVVGGGSAASCTADAFIAAVARGGRIVFDCGPDPVVITLDRPAKVFNDAVQPGVSMHEDTRWLATDSIIE